MMRVVVHLTDGRMIELDGRDPESAVKLLRLLGVKTGDIEKTVHHIDSKELAKRKAQQ